MAKGNMDVYAPTETMSTRKLYSKKFENAEIDTIDT